jgi:hypothetical protein
MRLCWEPMRSHAFPWIHVPAVASASRAAALHWRAARLPLLLALCACPSACSSDPGAQPGTDGGGSPAPGDGTAGDIGPVAHVPVDGAFAGSARLILQDGSVIDTDALTVDGQSHDGGPDDDIVFDVWPQGPDDPELAVLHLGDFGIQNGTVSVRGMRPLVIIARGEIRLTGVLDASATGSEPGPGGFGPGEGEGAGGSGSHAGNSQDGGGGGGGHGSAGGAGGIGTCVGNDCGDAGMGGAVYGTTELAVLQGGASGGAGSVLMPSEKCVPAAGGGGGGAVQLTARLRLRIDATGGVNVGGGGGAGGAPDLDCGDNGGGAGGGAGGAIFLQAPTIELEGVLAANGGGGGSGASFSMQFPGADASLGAEAAPGGERVNESGSPGGCGDSLMATCERNGTEGDNGGGGGGGVGRIVIVAGSNGFSGAQGVSSPAAIVRAQ